MRNTSFDRSSSSSFLFFLSPFVDGCFYLSHSLLQSNNPKHVKKGVRLLEYTAQKFRHADAIQYLELCRKHGIGVQGNADPTPLPRSSFAGATMTGAAC